MTAGLLHRDSIFDAVSLMYAAQVVASFTRYSVNI